MVSLERIYPVALASFRATSDSIMAAAQGPTVSVKPEDKSDTLQISTMSIPYPSTQAQPNSAVATSYLPSRDVHGHHCSTHSLKPEPGEPTIPAPSSYVARQGTMTTLSTRAEGVVFTSPPSTPASCPEPSVPTEPVSLNNLIALMGFMRESLQTMPIPERMKTSVAATKLFNDALSNFERLGQTFQPLHRSLDAHNDAPAAASTGQPCTRCAPPSGSCQPLHSRPLDAQGSATGAQCGCPAVPCISDASLHPIIIDDDGQDADGVASSSPKIGPDAENYQHNISGCCLSDTSNSPTEERNACQSSNDVGALSRLPVSSETTHATTPASDTADISLDDITNAELMYPPLTPVVENYMLHELSDVVAASLLDDEQAMDIDAAQDHRSPLARDAAAPSCPPAGVTSSAISDIGPTPLVTEGLDACVQTPGFLLQLPKPEPEGPPLDMKETAARLPTHVARSAVQSTSTCSPDCAQMRVTRDDRVRHGHQLKQHKPQTLLSRLSPRQDSQADTKAASASALSLRERLWVQFPAPDLDADLKAHLRAIDGERVKRGRDEDSCDDLPARWSKPWGDRIIREHNHKTQMATPSRYPGRSKLTKNNHFAQPSSKRHRASQGLSIFDRLSRTS